MTQFADGALGDLQKAMRDCDLAFRGEKKRLRDLSHRFWVALEDLQLAIEGGDTRNMQEVFKAAYRQLGAPGDFGYGTPAGQALKKLYDAWGEWLKSLPAAAVAG
jgi:hypothetical protein